MYMYSNMIVLDSNGNYNVSYSYNASSDTMEFSVQVKTTGWVGFGVAENAPTNMFDYDVAIGGVSSNGTGYIQVGWLQECKCRLVSGLWVFYLFQSF